MHGMVRALYQDTHQCPMICLTTSFLALNPLEWPPNCSECSEYATLFGIQPVHVPEGCIIRCVYGDGSIEVSCRNRGGSRVHGRATAGAGNGARRPDRADPARPRPSRQPPPLLVSPRGSVGFERSGWHAASLRAAPSASRRVSPLHPSRRFDSRPKRPLGVAPERVHLRGCHDCTSCCC